MFKTSDFRGTIRDGSRFSDMSGDTLYQAIARDLPRALKEAGIPCSVREDSVKSGGIFGTHLPMLLVSHPNPPSKFFSMGFVVNGNVVSFVYLGESTQNTKMNTKKALEAEGKYLRAAMVKPDEFLLQQEHSWNASVLDVFDSLCNGG